MSVYDQESPDYLAQCLESLVMQTRPAEEILIVKDGPLGEELEAVLQQYARRLPMVTIALESNQGLGAALRIGVEHCKHELIARMDSDDICVPFRFEQQVTFMETHPEIDVLGGSITEFAFSPGDGHLMRKLPADHESISNLARHRNPVNHVTVIFRKSKMLAAGSYRSWIGFEDYYLWVRMLLKGSRFHNLQETLVQVRCGNGMQNRRGGWKYIQREAALFREFHRQGFLTKSEAFQSILLRCPARLLPVTLRTQIYKTLLRSRLSEG